MINIILLKTSTISITTHALTAGHLEILMEGQLVIKNADAVKNALLHALAASDSLSLVFRNIVKLDLSVLQLVVAMQKSSFGLSKKLTVDIEPSDYTQSVITNSGLADTLAASSKIPS
jgi:hypothetical protein